MDARSVLKYLKELCRRIDEGGSLQVVKSAAKPLALPAALAISMTGGCLEPEPDPCPEVAYYGPAPCTSDEQCETDHGDNWYCDQQNTFGDGECAVVWAVCAEREPDPCPDVAYYGPQPCASDADCEAQHGAGWYCDEDNTFGEGDCASAWPVCREVELPCPDVAYYGPAPCTTDEQCEAEHGEGWYCDEENAFGEGDCAQTWAVCREGATPDPCPDIAYYGPAPCTDDEQCQAEHGENWYCDNENTFGEGDCAQTWALCKEREQPCPDVAWYGPAPCTEDAQCQAEHGTNWYCDQDNTFGEDECAQTWAVCKEREECPDVAYYGPAPCTEDAQCQAEHGEGWYCDEEFTLGEGDCLINWSACREGPVDS